MCKHSRMTYVIPFLEIDSLCDDVATFDRNRTGKANGC